MQAAQASGVNVPAEFTDLVRPHVESFDYFLNEGLQNVAELLDPLEVSLLQQTFSLLLASDYCRSDRNLHMQIKHPITKQSHRIWFENPYVGKPLKEIGGGRHERLFPRDCREGVSISNH